MELYVLENGIKMFNELHMYLNKFKQNTVIVFCEHDLIMSYSKSTLLKSYSTMNVSTLARKNTSRECYSSQYGHEHWKMLLTYISYFSVIHFDFFLIFIKFYWSRTIAIIELWTQQVVVWISEWARSHYKCLLQGWLAKLLKISGNCTGKQRCWNHIYFIV